MEDMILETICLEVKDGKGYTLMVDESKDISKKEQLTIVLRKERRISLRKNSSIRPCDQFDG